MERWAPRGWGPYLRLSRLDRPIGTWLLLLPGWWALALAAEGWPDVRLLLLFAIGAVVMRGAGCTFNDIVDRDFDARVARTRLRPLPSGEVTVRQAALWMAAQLAVGAVVLFSLTPTAILLGIGVLVLIGTYPFMKRVTWWPQLFLGLNFNWGALVGWAAVADRIEWPALLLYVGGIFWTLGYDTIYAHQDKEDDALIGVKSSARALGSRTRPFLFLVYAVAAGLWAAAGLDLAWPFWAALAGVTAHLFWQAVRVDTDSPTDCLQKFRSNRDLGLLLFAGIVLGKLV
jgi:4-hydroxybenzoate polyprenyltransferase